jgi:hypothetical protein
LHAARSAREQPDAEFFLKEAHLPAERRLGDPQPFGRARQ